MRWTGLCILFTTYALQAGTSGQFLTFSQEKLFKHTLGKTNLYKGVLKHAGVQEIPLEWKWGVRTGFGYTSHVSNWDLFATYTKFHSKQFSATQIPSGIFVPTWQEKRGGTMPLPSWRLHLELADIEFSKETLSDKHFVLRPHVGIRGAWIYQKSKMVQREDLQQSPVRAKVPFFANNCLGLGLRGGMDSSWHIGRHLSLYGDGALSMLAGYYNIDQPRRPIQRGAILSDEPNRVTGGINAMELALGMQFHSLITPRSHINIRLGYECNYFFNGSHWMNWFSNAKGSLADAGSGLVLQGTTLGIRLDF